MADNIDVTPGTGKTIGTRETTIAGIPVHLQRDLLTIVRNGAFQGHASGKGLTAPDCGLYTLPRHAASPTTSSIGATTTAYVAGDAIGDGRWLNGAVLADACNSVGVSTLVLVDKDNKKAPIDFLIMDRDPRIDIPTAPVDSTPWSPTLTDLLRVQDIVHFATADYQTIGGLAIAVKTYEPHKIWATGGTVHPWAVPIAQGAVTYSVTDALWLDIVCFAI